ncbi:MAG: hypothetical protein MUE69_04055 [Myxococcota bacterium]|nr:hypothetical protein [Myxococcota bacterium]
MARGWRRTEAHEAEALEHELRRELSPGHVLKGRRGLAVARNVASEDVAYVLDDGRVCVVHLTWKIERDPRWPQVTFVAEIPEEDAD